MCRRASTERPSGGWDCWRSWRHSPLIPLKLFFIDWIKETFKSGRAAGLGFLVTGAVLLLVSRRLRGPDGAKGPAETSFLDALLIGLAQMFAPLPGVSRSGLTIASALALGFSPIWAVGFSLLIAVPAISGAALSELKDALHHPESLGLTPDRIGQTVAATVVAGMVGYFAILWLIRVVRSGQLWYFSVYLFALGTLVLALSAISGGTADARPAKALDRTAGGRGAGSPAGRAGDRAGGALDHAHAAGARPDRPGLDVAEPGSRSGLEGLLLGRSLADRPPRGRGRAALALANGGPSGL